jgi:hypothetical protein
MAGVTRENIDRPDEVRQIMTAVPGHDAWIIGNEPCVVIDWQGMADYAK